MSRLREMIDTPALIYGDHQAGVDECYGPEAAGTCPRAATGERVACADR